MQGIQGIQVSKGYMDVWEEGKRMQVLELGGQEEEEEEGL
jgi:hypothetical protein